MIANQDVEKLYPVFVYIQSNLTHELTLERVAAKTGLSPFHFHRTFNKVVGETLKQYTQRLRLEQAAYQLKILDASILNIALNAGYKNHETFTRAFKRWFGVTPKQFRESFGRSTQANLSAAGNYLNSLATDFTLSKVIIKKVRSLPVAFIRNFGPYIEVDSAIFDRLNAWADSEGLFTGNNMLLGVGHDDPAITPEDKVRFDLCITVPESFKTGGEVGFQTLAGGYFASAEYVGPFGPTMEGAYFRMIEQILKRPRYEFIGLPAIEIYRTTNINLDYALNHTEILLPVRPLNSASQDF